MAKGIEIRAARGASGCGFVPLNRATEQKEPVPKLSFGCWDAHFLVRLPSTPRNGFSRPLSTIALWGGTHARQGKNINSRSTEFLAFVTESNWGDKFDKLETGLKHRLAGLRECGGKEREHVFSKHRRRSRSRRFDEGAISYKNPPQRRAAFFLIHIWCPWFG